MRETKFDHIKAPQVQQDMCWQEQLSFYSEGPQHKHGALFLPCIKFSATRVSLTLRPAACTIRAEEQSSFFQLLPPGATEERSTETRAGLVTATFVVEAADYLQEPDSRLMNSEAAFQTIYSHHLITYGLSKTSSDVEEGNHLQSFPDDYHSKATTAI